jgi:hypothetical protein
MATTTDARRINERFGYFIRGRQIVIVEWKITPSTITDEPDYTSPTESITNGLMLEYTAIDDLSEILTSKDSLPVHDTLALAIVDYIKAQLVEDVKDYSKKEYYMRRFKDRIAKYTNARIGGIRRVLGDRNMR